MIIVAFAVLKAATCRFQDAVAPSMRYVPSPYFSFALLRGSAALPGFVRNYYLSLYSGTENVFATKYVSFKYRLWIISDKYRALLVVETPQSFRKRSFRATPA